MHISPVYPYKHLVAENYICQERNFIFLVDLSKSPLKMNEVFTVYILLPSLVSV